MWKVTGSEWDDWIKQGKTTRNHTLGSMRAPLPLTEYITIISILSSVLKGCLVKIYFDIDHLLIFKNIQSQFKTKTVGSYAICVGLQNQKKN